VFSYPFVNTVFLPAFSSRTKTTRRSIPFNRHGTREVFVSAFGSLSARSMIGLRSENRQPLAITTVLSLPNSHSLTLPLVLCLNLDLANSALWSIEVRCSQ